MPLRDVMVRLSLNSSGFVAGTKAAQAATAKLGGDITKTAAAGSRSAGVLGSSFGTVGIVAGLAAAKMISAASDFESSMSAVKATGADAAKNIDSLRDAAIKAGAATKYSATEAAGGVESLAKAGVSSADVLGGGLKGALDLAAAGNLDVAGSAEAAASAMNQFGLAGKDVPHIADLLAAGAGKAQGEVSDMAQALNQAGLIAHGAGASIEETTGVLSAMASAGLVGSDAGTSLKVALQRLQAPTDKARALMDQYNISLYDGEGHYQGLAAVAGQLQDNMSNLSEEQRSAALAIIFGTDAVRGANVLYSQGEEGIKNWTKAVDDSGFAAEVAGTKMDNLKGDIEKAKGSWETLAISMGTGTQSPARQGAQGAELLGNGLNQLAKRNLLSPNWFANLESNLLSKIQNIGAAGKAGVSRKVYFQIDALGANATVGQIAKVAQAARLTPKQVTVTLRQQGFNTDKIDAVIARMRDRTIRIKMVQLGGTGLLEQLDKLDQLTKRQRLQLRVDLKATGLFTNGEIDKLLNPPGKRRKATVDVQPKLQGSIRDALGSGKSVGVLKVPVEPDTKAVATGISSLKKFVGKKPPAMLPVDANTKAALSSADDLVRSINAKHASIYVGLTGPGAGSAGPQNAPAGGHATGGPIVGRGTGTSDEVPIMASNGEHMWTARETEAVGGHAAMYRLRSAALSGSLPAFASGGPVGLTSNQWALEIARLQAQISDNRSQLKTAKGPAKRVLELEYIESKAALRRLKGGLSSDFDYGLQSILDARNEPVSLFGGFSDSPWMQGGNFGSQATQKLTQIRTLAGKLAALRKMGLTGALIGEIASLGSGQGIAAADELLKSPSQIRQLNAAYSGIQGYNGVIAAAAYQAPYAGGSVRVSIENFSVDVKKQTAHLRVVMRDEAGKVIDQQSFNQAVHS